MKEYDVYATLGIDAMDSVIANNYEQADYQFNILKFEFVNVTDGDRTKKINNLKQAKRFFNAWRRDKR